MKLSHRRSSQYQRTWKRGLFLLNLTLQHPPPGASCACLASLCHGLLILLARMAPRKRLRPLIKRGRTKVCTHVVLCSAQVMRSKAVTRRSKGARKYGQDWMVLRAFGWNGVCDALQYMCVTGNTRQELMVCLSMR